MQLDGLVGAFVGREHDVEALCAMLAGRERLITLVGAAGIGKTRLARELATVSTLLARAPQVQIIVTSRERLYLGEERVYELPPLGVGDGVALVVDRIGRARAGSPAVDDAELAIYEAIVRELDGLPLALELTAVRVGVLGASNVLARLDRRLDVLTRVGPSSCGRPLRRTIDWSWELLDATEQLVLARCSIFRSGFTLDAALAITTDVAPPRIGMDALQAFGLARGAGLETTVARMVGERAMTAYACCAFDAALGLFRESVDALAHLDAPAQEAVILTKLATVHREKGELVEAERCATRALPLHRAAGNAMHEAVTIAELALLRLESGDLDAARTGLARALALCALTGNRLTEGFIRGWVGVVEHAAGDLPLAEEGYIAALRVIRDVGYSRFEGGTLGYLGVIAFDRGELELASERLDRARTVLAASGDRRHTALFTGYLAATRRALGDDTRANVLLEDARSAVGEGDPLRTAIELVHADRPGARWPTCTSDHAGTSWDVRLALRRIEGRPPSAPPSGSIQTILVALDGTWIEKHPGKRVLCDRRGPAMRLLATLAAARFATPGRPVPGADLVSAGWPGERILPAAAKNRVRVAMSWLRRAGLGRTLIAVGDAYVLEADEVTVVPSEASLAAAPPPSSRRHLQRAQEQ